uniref:Cadherin domain-containing protein n=1 Tax=Clytia hemisphaerica TaxID=252671 RepID=A0A7M5WRJ4_9CNID
MVSPSLDIARGIIDNRGVSKSGNKRTGAECSVTFVTKNPYIIETPENLPYNSTLGKISAISNELEGERLNVIYEIDEQELVAIEPDSGRIYNKIVFDSEVLKSVYSLSANAYTEVDLKVELELVLIIINQNDNPPLFNHMNYTTTVPEDLPIGGLIIRVTANDLDGLQQIRYSLQDENEMVEINRFSGEIRTKKKLDFEQETKYELVVFVTDGKFNSNTTLTVHVSDVDDQGPVFEQTFYNASLVEGTYTDALFVTQLRVYDNESVNVDDTVTYSLKHDKEKPALRNGSFTIGNGTGGVYFTGEVDWEMVKELNLVFMATTTTFITSVLLHIQVVNINDNNPAFPQQVYRFTIPENAANETVLIKLHATDPDDDELSYNIISNDSIPFSINNDDELFVAGSLNREAKDCYTFQVEAEERDTVEHKKTFVEIHINITDINDNVPVFHEIRNVFQIKENNQVPYLIHTFLVTDPDLNDNGEIEFSLNGDDDCFHIDNNGTLICKCSFDREGKSSYQLNVVASDKGKLVERSASYPITIKVLDDDDNFPFCEPLQQSVYVVETRAVNTIITTINARDVDHNQTLAFQIVSGDLGDFLIDSESGEVSIKRELDREESGFYFITINVTDVSNQTTSCYLNITILDVNDNDPQFDHEIYYFNVTEERPSGVVVGRVRATDADSTEKLFYSLLDENNKFELNETTGIITTKRAIDREEKSSYTLMVQAADGGLNPRLGRAQVFVKVSDINDNPPYFLDDVIIEVGLDSTFRESRTVYHCQAFDKDEGANAEVVYQVVSPPPEWLEFNATDCGISLFSLPNVTEELIIISATNTEPPFENATKELTITYKMIPNFSQKTYNINVTENTPSEEEIFQFELMNNAFVKENVSFTIAHGGVGNAFHFVNDKLFASKSLDRELRDSYEFIVSVQLIGAKDADFASVQIAVVDENDDPPKFTKDSIVSLTVFENTVIDIQPFTCTDDDAWPNDVIEYNMSESELFTINSRTGKLSLTRMLDYERDEHEMEVNITCRNTEFPYHTDIHSVYISLKDVNDNAPVFEKSVYRMELEENVQNGTLLNDFNAIDIDSGEDGMVSYQVEDDSSKSECFLIDGRSLLLKCGIDYEEVQQVKLKILAFDHGTPSLQSFADVIINIIDSNDHMPIIEKTMYRFSLDENKPNGTFVGKIDVSDADESEEPCQFCVIVEDDMKDLFEIDSKGNIYSKRIMDFEKDDTSFSFTIRAYQFPTWIGKEKNSLSVETNIGISLNDMNDNLPYFADNKAFKGISPEHSSGDSVFVVKAYDTDKSSVLSYAISSGNEDFFLDSKTGVIFPTTKYKVRADPQIYTLDIQASDSLHQAVLKLVFFTYNNSHLVEFETSANASQIQSQKQLLEKALTDLTSKQIFVQKIRPTNSKDKSNVMVFGFDQDSNTVMAENAIESLVHNKTVLNVLWLVKKRVVTSSLSDVEDEDNDRELLIGIIIGVCSLVVCFTIAAVYLWLRGEQRSNYQVNQSRQASQRREQRIQMQ